ncbi:MAG TPA: outer membrane beta-barrel protein [Terriglobales bacterium]|jgi:hypothetical protein
MKHFRWLIPALCLLCSTFAVAQSVDAYLGAGTLITKSGQNGIPTLGGGTYLNAGGDLIFLPHGLGFGAQATWRASQTNYFGVGARPVFYSFDGIWQPVPPGIWIRPDFKLGIGAENLRYYQGVLSCGTFTGCTNHSSSNHFVLHAGIGVKFYFTDHLFLRPAVDYYNIRHNFDYGVPSAWQAAISLGYTLGPSS